MATSDLIAQFILNAIEESENGFAELRRSGLAERFSVVPSQINYVIQTRFSPEHGYIVESRRGGGGYIKITRVRHSPRSLVMNTINSVGTSLDLRTAYAFTENLYSEEIIGPQIRKLILAAVSDNALRPVEPSGRDTVRAAIYKNILLNLLGE
ncbi:MAG: CtsR family transcriptional regulator [Oscillospiraceae bacterium]|nr:CtsR family transcriptional regulator [Oscillospiraceae bacterium]